MECRERIQNRFLYRIMRLALMSRTFKFDTINAFTNVIIYNSHDIYKWHSGQQRRPRAASFAGSSNAPQDPAFEHIHQPGGFRRNYLLLRANEQGADEPRMLNSFIDFLFIFGHYVSPYYTIPLSKYSSAIGW